MDKLSMEVSKAAIAAMNRKDEEIAKLREQLAEAQARLAFRDKSDSPFCDSCAAWEQMAWEMKQRAEAAEAKLKAASEPVAIYEGDTSHLQYLQDSDMEKNWRWHRKDFVRGQKLYAAPIPPADVQELQNRLSKLNTQLEVINEANTKAAIHITELERKLAEQQSITQQAIALMEPMKNYLPPEHVSRWIACITSPSKHFDTVIAQAREEGRKEAVPNCSICVNRGKVYKLSEESNCSHCKWQEAWRKDLFASAPKPEEKP